MWCSKSSQQWENFFDIIVLQFVGHPPGGYEILFHFIVIVSLLPSSYGFFFIFGHGYLFLVGSSALLLMVIQQLVAILVLYQQEMSADPSIPPS